MFFTISGATDKYALTPSRVVEEVGTEITDCLLMKGIFIITSPLTTTTILQPTVVIKDRAVGGTTVK